MRSMTGFGKDVADGADRKVTVEIKTVNNKLLDISIKAPRIFAAYEDNIRKIIKNFVKRGRVDVFVSYNDYREKKGEVIVDKGVAKQYLEAGKVLEELGFDNDLSVAQVLKMPDVLTVIEDDQDDGAWESLLIDATTAACKALVENREREGENMKADLIRRLDNLSEIWKEIVARAPVAKENYAAKLKIRIKQYLEDVEMDESRFVNEVAFFADKSNIDEEIARMRSHLDAFYKLMDTNGEVGKQLDFLVQELNREINTTGSKSNDIELTRKVLLAKNELEKFREQVQNIE